MKNILILASLLWYAPSAHSQTRWYVRADATGQNTGLNWINAFNSLQPALHGARAGDTIWVAAGAYTPTAQTERDSAFRLPSGVVLLGGFAGAETRADQRDWTKNETVLSGDIGVPGDSTDNSFTILFLDNPDSLTLIDGLIFRYGRADDTAPGPLDGPKRCGGAVYIDGESGEAYPVFRYCRFEYNHAAQRGGAVYVNGKDLGSVAPQFLHCAFVGNTATLDAGAVYRRGGAWVDRYPDFGNCTFEDNRALTRWAGAILWEDDEMQDSFDVLDCTFSGNEGIFSGCMMLVVGRLDGSFVKIKGCRFEKNNLLGSAYGVAMTIVNYFNFREFKSIEISDLELAEPGITEYNHSLIFIDGYGLDSASTVSLNNLNITQTALSGGSFLYIALELRGNVIQNNLRVRTKKPPGAARATYVVEDRLTISNTSMFADTCNGFLFQLNMPFCKNAFISNFSLNQCDIASNTGAIGVNRTNATFVNCQFNVYDLFRIETSLPLIKSNIRFINSAIQANRLAYQNAKLSELELDFDHCWIDTSVVSFASLPPNVRYNSACIFDPDPMFVDTPDSRYAFNLLPCSPLIGAGDNSRVVDSFDLAGNPRIRGKNVDIGVYETPALAFDRPSDVKAACQGDSTGVIRVFPSGGCEPYTFIWGDGVGDSTRTGLAAGAYTLMISDGVGDMAVDTLTVPASFPSVALLGDTLLCGAGATGALSALPGGSYVAPATFVWNTGDSTATLTGLPAGAYAVTLTDAAGCTDSAAARLLAAPLPGTFSSVTNATHPDSANGRIDFAVLSGTQPFAYVWSTGDSTASLAGLAPGFYTLVLFDGAGCNYGFVFEVGVTSSTAAPGSSAYAGRLWPNPAQDVLYVEWGAADAWRLYDASGRQAGAGVAQGSVQALPLAGLPAGSYVFCFYREGRVMQGVRVVKE